MGVNIAGTKATWNFPGFESFQTGIKTLRCEQIWSDNEDSVLALLQNATLGTKINLSEEKAKAKATLEKLVSITSGPRLSWYDRIQVCRLLEVIDELEYLCFE